MQKFEVKIKSNPAYPYYMQHRMDDQKLEDWEKQRGRIIERDDVNKEDYIRALFHSYQTKDGKYYMPSEHIRSSLINAGKFIKSKVGNGKKSMANIVAGMFYVSPEEILLNGDFDIDKRSAVNKNIKARIISIRPKWKNWAVKFTLSVDNDTITQETIRTLLDYAGNYVGIGSYRPEHNGQFGRFILEELKKI